MLPSVLICSNSTSITPMKQMVVQFQMESDKVSNCVVSSWKYVSVISETVKDMTHRVTSEILLHLCVTQRVRMQAQDHRSGWQRTKYFHLPNSLSSISLSAHFRVGNTNWSIFHLMKLWRTYLRSPQGNSLQKLNYFIQIFFQESMKVRILNIFNFCEIWGSHSSDYVDCCLTGYDTM